MWVCIGRGFDLTSLIETVCMHIISLNHIMTQKERNAFRCCTEDNPQTQQLKHPVTGCTSHQNMKASTKMHICTCTLWICITQTSTMQNKSQTRVQKMWALWVVKTKSPVSNLESWDIWSAAVDRVPTLHCFCATSPSADMEHDSTRGQLGWNIAIECWSLLRNFSFACLVLLREVRVRLD